MRYGKLLCVSLEQHWEANFSVVIQNTINVSFTDNCGKTKKLINYKNILFLRNYVTCFSHYDNHQASSSQEYRKKVNNNKEIFQNELLIRIKTAAVTLLHHCSDTPVFF
jgi:hypothetical protein